jgi:hypothetical protein
MRGFLQGCRERHEATGGGSYGSRWSRGKRETTGLTTRPDFPTAAAVAEGIHAAWYLIRDPGRGQGTIRVDFPVVSRSASDHRLPYESPPATAFR